jgi:putative peptidoglycan lipid II flippase
MKYGAIGLTASAGIAGWIEFVFLRRGLTKKIGHTGLVPKYVVTLWAAALPAALVAWGVKLLMLPVRPVVLALVVLPVYGIVYIGMSLFFRVPEARGLTERVLRKVRR